MLVIKKRMQKNITFINHRSSHMNYFIYFMPFHSSREIWTQQIDFAPNVRLHSSVGRASHQYFMVGTGSNPIEALIFSGFFFPIA